MILFDEFENEYYYLDLCQKWWYFFVFWIVWFLPLHATKINNYQTHNKKTSKIGLGFGLGIGIGLIISDILQSINTFKLSSNSRVIIFLVSIVVIMLVFKLFCILLTNKIKKNRLIEESKVKVRLKIHFNMNYFMLFVRQVLGIFFFISIYEFSGLDFALFIVAYPFLLLLSVLISLGAPFGYFMETEDGRKLKVCSIST